MNLNIGRGEANAGQNSQRGKHMRSISFSKYENIIDLHKTKNSWGHLEITLNLTYFFALKETEAT